MIVVCLRFLKREWTRDALLLDKSIHRSFFQNKRAAATVPIPVALLKNIDELLERFS
jgi:hypothetical protein